ncbi:MAG: NADH:ubiquinone oxidoreductase subunit N, partial [Gammaproteobacteria bacterium]|nr:NADH:ubiquinone oxidoreductase subunit N [Gammaproteobacteria bacterium]
MNFVIPQFAPAMAEIALATGICVVLLADLFISPERKSWTLWLALTTLLVTAWFVGAGAEGGTVLTFDGSFVADGLARVLKLFTLIVVAIVFVYSHAYLRDRGLLKG